jgi:drug/metabolite transporter (DMT)-like permease
MEMLFLLSFSLHNIEEALWLPAWSKHAERYHKKVTENEFRFAVIIVTAIGYLITFQYFLFPGNQISKFIYSGFVLMMVANAIFPHMLATIALRRYAPGTITGVMLNVPVGAYILTEKINIRDDITGLIIGCAAVSFIILLLLKHLFKAGDRFFSDN